MGDPQIALVQSNLPVSPFASQEAVGLCDWLLHDTGWPLRLTPHGTVAGDDVGGGGELSQTLSEFAWFADVCLQLLPPGSCPFLR